MQISVCLCCFILVAIASVSSQRQRGDVRPPVPPPDGQYCSIDLVFVIDQSCSLGYGENEVNEPKYREQLENLQQVIYDVIDELDIGEDKMQVKGYVTFDKTSTKYSINEMDKDKIKKQIQIVRDLPASGQCGTNTWDALTHGAQLLGNRDAGRGGILIVMTDGKPYLSSSDNTRWPNTASDRTKTQAEANIRDGIVTIAITLPNKDPTKQEDEADKFQEVFDWMTDGERARQKSITEVLGDSGQAVAEIMEALTTECRGQVEDKEECKLELTFILDRSDSITIPEIQNAKNLMKAIVGKIKVDSVDGSSIAIFSYNSEVFEHAKRADCVDNGCVEQKIDLIPEEHGILTRTDLAIKKCGNYFISEANDRADIPHVCVVLTDGRTYVWNNATGTPKRNKAITVTEARFWDGKQDPFPVYTEIIALNNHVGRSDMGEWRDTASHWVFNEGTVAWPLEGDHLEELSTKIATKLCNELPKLA